MLDPHTRFQKTLPLAGETHRGTRNLTISPDLGNKTVNLFMARIYWLVTKLLKFLDGKKTIAPMWICSSLKNEAATNQYKIIIANTKFEIMAASMSTMPSLQPSGSACGAKLLGH